MINYISYNTYISVIQHIARIFILLLYYIHRRYAGSPVAVQYMREYNAESPKQDSKRFNSLGIQNTLRILVYYLSMSMVGTNYR